MKAFIVFESHWGNTAAIARAIAQGIGGGAVELPTGEASRQILSGAGLIVAGAPLLGFALPTDKMLRMMGANAHKDPVAPDLSQPSLRSWLQSLDPGSGLYAAFETRLSWSPGSAVKTIGQMMEKAGHRMATDPVRFIVKGKYGPLRDNELERARRWGEQLNRLMQVSH
jgi:flavorubredoxin